MTNEDTTYTIEVEEDFVDQLVGFGLATASIVKMRLHEDDTVSFISDLAASFTESLLLDEDGERKIPEPEKSPEPPKFPEHVGYAIRPKTGGQITSFNGTTLFANGSDALMHLSRCSFEAHQYDVIEVLAGAKWA